MGAETIESGYALLHNHTTDSVRDSVMSLYTLVDRAAELGYKAVGKSEHGTMIGYHDFYEYCLKKGIKPVMQVEVYVEVSGVRYHMVLTALDNQGWHAMCKAVTESNEHVVKVGTMSFPLMDKQMIQKWFGKGSAGYGHVAVTSACVSGVLAGIWFNGKRKDEKLEKLIEKRDSFISETDADYLKLKSDFETLQSEISELQAKIAQAKKTAAKPTTALEKRASSGKTQETRDAAQKELEEVIRSKEQASKDLEELMVLKEKKDAQLKEVRVSYGKMKLSVEKWAKLNSQIEQAGSGTMSDEDCIAAIKKEAVWYKETIAPGHFFIELQYHGMEEEGYVMPILAQTARELDIPVIAANDAHIPTNSDDDVLARQIIRATRFDKWEDASAADREMYIKSPKELTDTLLKILPEDIVDEAMANTGRLADMCSVELKKENHYPKFVTPSGETPEEYLTHMAYAGIEKRYGAQWSEKHEERLQHELSVICKMGYADYHLIVQDFLEYARCAGKLDLTDPKEIAIARTFDMEKIKEATKDRPGECVGPGRGSAAGSIVCYLIGITNIDPIRYDLLFERFLNPERVSMPEQYWAFDVNTITQWCAA